MFYTRVAHTLALGAAVLVIAGGAIPVQAKPSTNNDFQPRKVIIVHTNDVHGNVAPDDKGRGGLVRVATIVNKLRASNPKEVIYLDAGDVAQGTAVSNTFQGAPTFASIAAMKPAVGTIGNHEFDWGVQAMKDMTKAAGYPFVLANVYDAKTGELFFDPYRIVEVNGIKLGIIGILDEATPKFVKKGNTDGLVFANPSETVRKYLPKMRADGAQVIVALTHNGFDNDKQLAANVPEIDLIVGGHSHTQLDDPVNVGGHTWIVQTGKYARNVGVEEMLISPFNYKIVGFNGRLIKVDKEANIEDDPEVSAILKKYDAKIRPQMEVVVGELGGELLKKCAAGEADSSLGNAMCEALRVKTESDIAVYNYGGIRVDSMSAGKVTRGAVYQFLPFDDQVCRMEIQGKYIQELLDQAAKSEHGPLQTAGITCKFDKSKKIATDVKIGGQPLDPAKTYILATTEFLCGGGDGFSALSKGKIIDRYDFTRDVFIDYLDDFKVLEVPATGNIVIVE
ncbi:MAG: bifunctional UDP-sugar hydrolase/5'-nucleotidase [bacterium]|nr:bifunctional UDP-sugar hydrolase/5'-nucleotidase [bacterium]